MKFLLIPFSIIYRIIIKIRNLIYDYDIIKSKEFEISTISIGNITVGGTGKTPHTEYLVNLLKNQFNIAVLSRGYKRKSKGFVLAEEKISYSIIGDEPKQIFNKNNDINVAVCENRVIGIQKIIEFDKNTEIVILDDAFQHRRIKPDISILLTDYNNLFIYDKMLPVGRLRESKHSYSRANIIIVTKCPEDLKPIDRRVISKNINVLPFQTIYFTYIKYKNIYPVFKNKEIKDIDNNFKFADYQILLVTGIASSELLKKNIAEKYSSKLNHLEFKDHQNFSKKDIERIENEFNKIETNKKIILTTEKDAVRLFENQFINDEIRKYFYYIEIEIDFLFDAKKEFNNQVVNNVIKNKANSQLQTTIKQF